MDNTELSIPKARELNIPGDRIVGIHPDRDKI